MSWPLLWPTTNRQSRVLKNNHVLPDECKDVLLKYARTRSDIRILKVTSQTSEHQMEKLYFPVCILVTVQLAQWAASGKWVLSEKDY